MRQILFTIAAGAALTGCATSTEPTEPAAAPVLATTSPLADTNWTLLDVRTPHDAEPTDVKLNAYMLTLQPDGQAALKLDCNRGTTRWSAREQEKAKGTISFGPIAATRALCADDGQGERLARDLSGTWPYEVYDGRLTIRTAGTTYTFDVID